MPQPPLIDRVDCFRDPDGNLIEFAEYPRPAA